ncbi:YbhB/YbcL family Raf kinase inhibitor-like protein [Brevundimonas sp.]|uniref:YbhB/YbcL family Raf kinase inhibitor-like protein n=1 Tax=Brevundimonas sp. TaxID=1871086 RepID=UPI00289B742E|nr:YbhB/YbcL family Raf kinase inhibitor-like protein [Brevundimonas sp.]
MAQSHPGPSGQALTFARVTPYQSLSLAMTSDAVDVDGWMGAEHSQASDATSPPLAWSGLLEAESYALIVEDPDAPGETSSLHWMLWNIPGDLTALPADIPPGPHPSAVPGAVQGANSRGEHGWLGMAPPPGSAPHHYHFQLFALDRKLELSPQTPLAKLVNVLKGCAIAKGELVGRYQAAGGIGDAPAPARTGAYGVDPATDHATRAEIAAGRGPLDSGDIDRHAPHDDEGVTRPRGGEAPDPKRPFRL